MSCRSKTTDAIVESESEDPRTKDSWWYKSQARERITWDEMLQLRTNKKKGDIFIPLPFVPSRPSPGWMMDDTHIEWGEIFTLCNPPIQMLISCGVWETHSEIMFSQISVHLVIHSSWHTINHHTHTCQMKVGCGFIHLTFLPGPRVMGQHQLEYCQAQGWGETSWCFHPEVVFPELNRAGN